MVTVPYWSGSWAFYTYTIHLTLSGKAACKQTIHSIFSIFQFKCGNLALTTLFKYIAYIISLHRQYKEVGSKGPFLLFFGLVSLSLELTLNPEFSIKTMQTCS